MRKPVETIEVGDTIRFLSEYRRITEIAAYDGPHGFIIGIARSGDDWGISLCEGATMEVLA